jgi:hypothetical protein
LSDWHNPRKGEKIEFTASEAQRYKERSQAERTNARLKDDYGGRYVRVRGNSKGDVAPDVRHAGVDGRTIDATTHVVVAKQAVKSSKRSVGESRRVSQWAQRSRINDF